MKPRYLASFVSPSFPQTFVKVFLGTYNNEQVAVRVLLRALTKEDLEKFREELDLLSNISSKYYKFFIFILSILFCFI